MKLLAVAHEFQLHDHKIVSKSQLKVLLEKAILFIGRKQNCTAKARDQNNTLEELYSRLF